MVNFQCVHATKMAQTKKTQYMECCNDIYYFLLENMNE